MMALPALKAFGAIGKVLTTVVNVERAVHAYAAKRNGETPHNP
ncbi:MAG: hypothetical protein ACLP07_14595 [Terracidiphilus sp.]